MLRAGAMPLKEVDTNTHLRSSVSRSSDVSTKPARQDACLHGPALQLDSISNSAGVQSMLKTTTEDDLSSLALKSNRLPKHLHAPRRQHGNPPSRPSSHYSRTGSRTGSIQSKSSNRSASDHQSLDPWPYGHFPRVSSLDNRSNPADHGNGNIHRTPRSIASASEKLETDQRSFSLTQNLSRRGLTNHRSANSLRNRAANSPRACSPHGYPARIRRPGFRPASPALSDNYALQASRISTLKPTGPPRTFTGSPNTHSKPTMNNPSPLRSGIFPQASWRTFAHNVPTSNHFDARTPSSEPRPRSFGLQKHPLKPDSDARYGKSVPRSNVLSPSSISDENQPIERNSHYKSGSIMEVPHVGFVKRVKQALEDRGIVDESSLKPRVDYSTPVAKIETDEVAPSQASEAKRLTRDMIKAAVGPPSDSGAISPVPDALEVGQGENSATESSSMRAYTSFDIPRAPSSPRLQNSPTELLGRVGDANFLNTSAFPASERANTQLVSEHFKYSVEEPMVAADTEPQGISKYTPSVPHPPLENGLSELDDTELRSNSNCSRRPSSLPQPDLEQSTTTKLDRRSLSALSELEQRPSRMLVCNHQVDQSSNALPSLSSLQTEETVATEVATGPSSTHSFFRSNSNASGEMGPLSTFKSYFKSKTRPFSMLSEPKSDIDIVLADKKTTFSPNADARPLQTQVSKTVSSRGTPEENEGAETSPASVNGADRLSAMKQYQFTLPDLAEDSQEDASTTNIRILGSKPPNFRSGALKRAKRENRISNQPTITLEPPPSYVSRKLKDTRNMPSLQFSQTDLTTKLNKALGFPCALSREDLTPLLEQSSSEQSEGSNSLTQPRSKYRLSGGENNHVDRENALAEFQPDIQPTRKVLLGELERLSIPSVNGLTLRLSELLPAIKTCHSQLDLTDPNKSLELDHGEAQELGPEQGHTILEGNRVSLMSTLITASAIHSRGSETEAPLSASLAPGERVLKYRLMKDLPPLPLNSSEKMSSAMWSSPNVVHLNEDMGNMPAELEATVPIESVNKERNSSGSLNHLNNTNLRSSNIGIPALRHAAGSENVSTGVKVSSLSWNEPFPATENALVNHTGQETQPSNASCRDILASNALTPDITERIVRSMSPGPHMENFLVPKSDTENELEENSSGGKGILGSIQRKIGRKPRIDKAGFPVDPIFFHPEERSTEPGDRYPTSGLTPPSHVNMEEARSYFSDDSSDNEGSHAGPIRKRLTRLRYRRSRNRQSSQTRARSRANSVPESAMDMPGGLPWDVDHASTSERSTLSVSHPDFVVVYDQQPVGMSKLEFRAKRLVEKLRIFWSKSEKLIRSLSRARKHQPNDWLEANELYEGA